MNLTLAPSGSFIFQTLFREKTGQQRKVQRYFQFASEPLSLLFFGIQFTSERDPVKKRLAIEKQKKEVVYVPPLSPLSFASNCVVFVCPRFSHLALPWPESSLEPLDLPCCVLPCLALA
jgi:hypothetical protein